MPWAVKDVEKHRKGLTPDQKKKWVGIANGVYSECMKKGNDAKCGPMAIKIANSKFSEEEKPMPNSSLKKFKASTFQFTDPDAVAMFVEGENKDQNADIVAYSGKDIPHWYWGKLAIDLSGMKFHGSKFPLLEDHMTSQKIGFTKKPIVTDTFQLKHNNVTFLNTPFAEDFQNNSKQGFPYQASIYAKPSVIESVPEGSTVQVNGRDFKGPGNIWRQSDYKETSVCVFGADSNTKSQAFADGEEFDVEVLQFSDQRNDDETILPNKGGERMDLTKLKEEDPAAYQEMLDAAKAQVKEEVKAEITAEVTADVKKGMETEFKATVTDLTTKLTDSTTRLMKMEKNEVIRQEKEIKLEAETMWADALSASTIPERLYAKVKMQLSYESFVKEGALDREAFSAAIAKEIEDWKDVGVGSKTVSGFGANGKSVDGGDIETPKADLTWVEKMKAKAGQGQKAA